MDEIYQDVLSIEEAKQILPILKDFIDSVGRAKNNDEIALILKEKFQTYLPDKTESEIEEYVYSIMNTMQTNRKKLESLNSAKQKGIHREAWFAEETRKAISYGSISQTLGYYETLSETVQQANEQMYNAITTKSGSISMNPNLDGFIAEQHHVNTYNLDAAVKGSSSRAEIVGHTGERFTKNGVDTRIRDRHGNIECKYQAKFGKNSRSTEKMFLDKDGNYKYPFQQKLVPEGQKISGKSTAVMQSKDGKISSTGLTKEEAKQIQLDAQNKGKIREYTFKDYELKQLAMGVGKQTANAALMGGAITTGVIIAEKAFNGEEITADEVIETALVSGADSGVKAAVSGALIIASEKGIISVIPKGTSAGVISSIAFIAVENAKIAGQVASGELSASEGLSRMMDVTVSAVTGIAVSFVASAEIGVAVGLVFGPIAGIVTGFVAGTVGYIAGSKVGQAISKGAKVIAKTAVNAVKTVGKAIVSAGRTVVNTVKSAVSSVCNGVKSFCSSVASAFGF